MPRTRPALRSIRVVSLKIEAPVAGKLRLARLTLIGKRRRYGCTMATPTTALAFTVSRSENVQFQTLARSLNPRKQNRVTTAFKQAKLGKHDQNSTH
jgi:hypothetical protein